MSAILKLGLNSVATLGLERLPIVRFIIAWRSLMGEINIVLLLWYWVYRIYCLVLSLVVV